MKLADNALNNYRECARSIWNGYFRQQFQISQDWTLVDSYKAIKEELFRSLVIVPTLGAASIDQSRPEVVRVRLSNGSPTPVLINRASGDDHGYWDHPIAELDGQAELRFIDLFDWDPYGFLDMSLVLAEILSCAPVQNVVGHRLLVDIRYASFVLDETPS